MEGAASGREKALNNAFEENDAMKYAAVRNILLRKGKAVSKLLANYEPSLHYCMVNGGNSCTAKAKEKTRRVFSRQQLTLQQTFTQWDSSFRTVQESMFETVINVEEAPEEIVVIERGSEDFRRTELSCR